jgi:hypothetical protein
MEVLVLVEVVVEALEPRTVDEVVLVLSFLNGHK